MDKKPRELFIPDDIRYDQITGLFWWTKKKRGRIPNRPAGVIRRDGYVLIGCCGINQYAHRIAWLYHYGEVPTCEIDHIDGNPSNNKICNLRNSRRHENGWNIGVKKNNTTGFKGVDYRKSDGKFRARIRIKGHRIELGLFSSAEAAHEAYCIAADKLHGRFARTE